MRLDERRRLGTRSAALEVDTDDHIYLFSSFDLGTDPAYAVAVERGIRATGRFPPHTARVFRIGFHTVRREPEGAHLTMTSSPASTRRAAAPAYTRPCRCPDR